MSRGRRKHCAYCGQPSEGGRDHVPGKQFFPSPRPCDLVTVPSCDKCNRGFKQDEDFFRSTFLFGPAGATPEGKRLWEQKLHRAHAKDLGLRKAIAAALAERQVVTPAGLHLGKHMTVHVDWPRVLRLFEKCVRGLYYFEVGAVLEPAISIESLPLVSATAHVMDSVRPALQDGQRSWPGVFEYKYATVPESPESSAWEFMFLDTHVFGAFTQIDVKEAATA